MYFKAFMIACTVVLVVSEDALVVSEDSGMHLNEIYYSTEEGVKVEFYLASGQPTDFYFLTHVGATLDPPHLIQQVDCDFNATKYCSIALGRKTVPLQDFLGSNPVIIILYTSSNFSDCNVRNNSALAYGWCGVEGVVYTSNTSANLSAINDIAKLPTVAIIKDSAIFQIVKSISHCPNDADHYHLLISSKTPDAKNDCPSPLPNIVISEIDFDQSNKDTKEFVELYGPANTSLDNITVVLYTGRFDSAYRLINLNGETLNSDGFYVIDAKHPRSFNISSFHGWIHNGANGIAVYDTSRNLVVIREGTPAMAGPGLIDAMVYGGPKDNVDTELIAALVKGQHQIFETASLAKSISRCGPPSEFKRLNMSTFGTASPTPLTQNANCTVSYEDIIKSLRAKQSKIRINEVNIDQPGSMNEFIELYDGGQGSIPLTDMSVVLYSQLGSAFDVYNLTDHKTNEKGFFVIGNETVDNVQYKTPMSFSQNGPDAVALYTKQITNETMADIDNLLDAVVYGKESQNDSDAKTLLDMLRPQGQKLLYPRQGYSSLSRCYSNRITLNPAFSVTNETSPGKENHCEMPPIVISEICPNRFVEISSKGIPFFPLDHIVQVHYDGNPGKHGSWSYRLSGFNTSAEGYFVTGSIWPGVDVDVDVRFHLHILSGPTAVAIYFGNRDDSDFKLPITVLKRSLIDAVCYGSTRVGVSQTMLDTLTPGRKQVNYDSSITPQQSINRCMNETKLQYKLAPLSSKHKNLCAYLPSTPVVPSSSPPQSKIVINELNSDSPGPTNNRKFIELKSLLEANYSLDGLTLVFFHGRNLYRVYDLSGNSTGADNYFVLGGSGIQNADIRIADNAIRDGPGAVVLYRESGTKFEIGTVNISTNNIIDFIIYGKHQTDNKYPFEVLAPGQKELYENDLFLTSDESLSRCLNDNTRTLRSFFLAPPTPGKDNNCTKRLVLINEVNANNLKTHTKEFIELYDGGFGYTPLNGYALVLFNSKKNASVYDSYDLNGYRTDINGYFLIGGQGMKGVDITFNNPSGFIQNGIDAVAIYNISSAVEYPVGSQPSTNDLVDAIVYGTDSSSDAKNLLSKLLPNQALVKTNEKFKKGEKSISRCHFKPKMSAAFEISDPTPRKENTCQGSTPSVELPKVLINEFDSDQTGPDIREFIELRGSPNTSLDGYVVALYNGRDGKMYYHWRLSKEHVTNSAGYFLMGSKNVQGADYEIKLMGVLQNGIDAITLFDGRGLSFESLNFDKTGLKDAVVYSKYSRDEMLEGFFEDLMLDKKHKHEDADFHLGEETLSRCGCDNYRNASCFMMTSPTPGSKNMCPQEQYSAPFQLKLINADCSKWQTNGKDNETLMLWTRVKIADGINKLCKCGFSADYITDFRIAKCGSIIFSGIFQAVSETHKIFVVGNYSKYINATKVLKVGQDTFTVDQSCKYGCYVPLRNPASGNAGVVAAVAVTCVILLIGIIAVTVFCIRKKRQGVLHFQLKRLDEDDCDAADDFIGGGDSASFANPMYSRLTGNSS